MYKINKLLEPQKIGLVIYGSLYHHEGILKDYLKSEYIRGPKLKISILGCNPFKENLTRVIDYDNGQEMETEIKLFNESLEIEQIKRYITLREGNINFIILYNHKSNEIINIPEHLIKNKNDIKDELKKVCEKNKIDYLFFTAYPAKITNIKKYLDNNNKKKNTSDYLKKCKKESLTKIEKEIIFF